MLHQHRLTACTWTETTSYKSGWVTYPELLRKVVVNPVDGYNT